MAKKARIGELRHRITFQSLVKSNDGQGGFTEVWSNLETLPTVWARVKPLSSGERLYGQKLDYQRSHEILIRYRSDITNTMRISYDSRTFQVKGTRDYDERGIYLIIDAEENQGT